MMTLAWSKTTEAVRHNVVPPIPAKGRRHNGMGVAHIPAVACGALGDVGCDPAAGMVFTQKLRGTDARQLIRLQEDVRRFVQRRLHSVYVGLQSISQLPR